MFEVQISKVRRIDRREVSDGRISIGRSSSNDVVLPGRAVSRRHCMIETQAGVSRVVDCESHYGTFVNGQRIHEPHVLEPGDVIDVGRFQVSFAGPGEAGACGPDDSTMPADEETLETRAVALHEAETDERADALAASEALVQERTVSLDEREAAIESKVESLLRERTAALGERETEISLKIATLEQLEAALKAHDQVLTERTEALHERESAAAETEQATAEREAELERAQTSLIERQQDLEERTALGEHRDELEQQLAQRDRELSTMASTVEARQNDLDAAGAREAQAIERLRQLETAQGEARHDGEVAERSLQETHAAAVGLYRAARRVDDARRMLPTLEELWFEADRSVEEAEDESPETLEEASIHRESIARRLENTHAELDAALGELQSELDRFETNIEVEPLDAAELRARRFRILPALRRRLHRSV